MRWTGLLAAGFLIAQSGWAEDRPAVLASVGITEKLGEVIPGQLTFVDSTGSQVQIQQYLNQGQPIILTLVYYQCPMLCNLVLGGLVQSLKRTGLKLGRDFQILTVSIDPRETAELSAQRKRGYLQSLDEPPNHPHWTLMTGHQAQILRLADSVGFQYAYDESTRQYAHAAGIFVLTPAGKISRYLYGFEYPPRDLRLALVEASGGKVGTSFDRFLLTCFRYEPSLRRYRLYVSGIIQGGGLAVFAGLCGLLIVLWRRELRRGSV